MHGRLAFIYNQVGWPLNLRLQEFSQEEIFNCASVSLTTRNITPQNNSKILPFGLHNQFFLVICGIHVNAQALHASMLISPSVALFGKLW